ncbi:serotriflin-like [Elgaria multicarinata webbii]|uniref:serotriflin-like n=1 Tax=Elgaria multicarinata webbii TaxID=159646 RepID=UPI002FCCCF55
MDVEIPPTPALRLPQLAQEGRLLSSGVDGTGIEPSRATLNMLLQIVLLSLAAVPQESLGQQRSSVLGEISEEDKKAIVDKHNMIRREVEPTAKNMLKMKWSDDATKTAENWVVQCSGEASPQGARTVDGRVCGESILRANYPSSWTDTVNVFASTKPYFKYGVGTTDETKDILSYTQIIWHHSNQIGCAHAFCVNSAHNFHYVCHYCPGGNIKGKLSTPYQEGPSCGDCANSCEDKLCNYDCKYIDDDYCEILLKSFKCNKKFVQQKCPASCNCPKSGL